MPRKVEERVIDGMTFTCQQSPFSRAFPLSQRAVHLFAAKGDDVQASKLLALAVFKRDPALLGDLLAGTQVDMEVGGQMKTYSLGSEKSRDEVFTNRLDTAISAALFAAEVEFKDFLGGVFAEKKPTGKGEDAETAVEVESSD